MAPALKWSTSTLSAWRHWFFASRDRYALVVVESPEIQLDSMHARTASTWGLTARREKVFRLVLEGLSNKEIANALGMPARTVEVHTRALFAKANVDSRARLIAKTWNLYRRGDEQGLELGAASSKQDRGCGVRLPA